MTKKRYYADMKDILAVRFTCKKCKTAFSVKPSEACGESYYRCHNCRDNWFGLDGEDVQAASALIRVLLHINSRANELPCSIQFELEQLD